MHKIFANNTYRDCAEFEDEAKFPTITKRLSATSKSLLATCNEDCDRSHFQPRKLVYITICIQRLPPVDIPIIRPHIPPPFPRLLVALFRSPAISKHTHR